MSAAVFWRSDASIFVLPLRGAEAKIGQQAVLDLATLECQTTLWTTPDRIHHILFIDRGRRLQLSIRGGTLRQPITVLTHAIIDRRLLGSRLMLLRRLSDLAATKTLRSSLYPAERSGRRLRFVLQALDGRLSSASHRDIASAFYGWSRVHAEWNDPQSYLRDRIRRAVRRGRALVAGGYRDLLS